MRIGTLRHLVSIDEPIETRDGEGNTSLSWQPFAENLPASIEPVSAREFIAAAATESAVSVRIVIRFVPGIRAKMRARRLDDGRVYDIEGVLEDPRSGQAYITLPCSTGVNNG